MKPGGLALFHSPGPVACFSDESDVSGNQNNYYWPLHNESIARCCRKSWYIAAHIWKIYVQKLVKDKKIHEARAFNFTYRYIDDVLSINNSRFAEFIPLIYPPELEVKETTDTASSASFLDLYLEFDDIGQISTKIYDKRDDFNFRIINFPNMCSNIPASPAYGVYLYVKLKALAS
jgi:hypothetical protein